MEHCYSKTSPVLHMILGRNTKLYVLCMAETQNTALQTKGNSKPNKNPQLAKLVSFYFFMILVYFSLAYS